MTCKTVSVLYIYFFRDVDVGVILRGLRGKLNYRPIRANQINALRGEEFDCASRAFSRANFDPESKLDVVFVDGDGVGEGSVDEGGPTREFCRLLARQLQSHQIFEGPLDRRTLALDSVGKLTCNVMHRNLYILTYILSSQHLYSTPKLYLNSVQLFIFILFF